jgi:HipA-like protein
MKAGLAEILRALGFRDQPALPASPKDEEVRVYLEIDSGRIYVGRLRRDREGFEFSYSPEFLARPDLPPIPDLPDKARVYKSSALWPFFLARLPPTDRPDVREQLQAAGIAADDVLEVLGKLGRRTISSPYDLELVAA